MEGPIIAEFGSLNALNHKARLASAYEFQGFASPKCLPSRLKTWMLMRFKHLYHFVRWLGMMFIYHPCY